MSITMHKLVSFAVIFVVAFKLTAQPATNKQPQLSANLQQWLNKSNAVSSQFNGLVLAKQQGILYVSALVKVATTINEKSLSQLEVLVGTKAGNIWTVQIPITQIKNFIKLKDIEYIQLDEPIVANLDIARKSSKVDSVQNGIGLPLGYSGKNVVVGIIDAGFDYGHPSFYDTSGNVLRIKKVWEQKNVGTPPAGYTYGNELVDTTSMLNKGTEVSTIDESGNLGELLLDKINRCRSV
jgi:subtilisin family serine protease